MEATSKVPRQLMQACRTSADDIAFDVTRVMTRLASTPGPGDRCSATARGVDKHYTVIGVARYGLRRPASRKESPSSCPHWIHLPATKHATRSNFVRESGTSAVESLKPPM